MIDDFDTLPKLPTEQDSTELRGTKTILEHYFSEQMGEGACDDIAGEIHALYAPVIEQAKKSGYDQHVRHMFSIEDAQSLKITELRERLDTTYTEGYMANKPEVFEAGKKEERERMMGILIEKGYLRGLDAIDVMKPIHGMMDKEMILTPLEVKAAWLKALKIIKANDISAESEYMIYGMVLANAQIDKYNNHVIQKGKACPVCKGEGYIYPNDAMKYDYSPSPNIKVLCNYCKGTRIAPTDPDITVKDAINKVGGE